MTRHVHCTDIVPGCQFRTQGESEEEILQKVAAHAAAVHGITDVTPTLVAQVKGAIREA